MFSWGEIFQAATYPMEAESDCGQGRDTIYSKLHPNLRLQKSRLGGDGLFAIAEIKEGEVIWEDESSSADELVYTLEEIKSWPLERQQEFMHFSYQVGEESFSGAPDMDAVRSDAAFFMNHSCDPTCWFLTDKPARMLARRDLKPDEEVTYDYATAETTDYRYQVTGWNSCCCGSSNCRRKLSGGDYARPDLQQRYQGHFMPHIQILIDKETCRR